MTPVRIVYPGETMEAETQTEKTESNAPAPNIANLFGNKEEKKPEENKQLTAQGDIFLKTMKI